MLEAFSEHSFDESSAELRGASHKHKPYDAPADKRHATPHREPGTDSAQSLLDVIPIGIGIAEDPSCTRVTINETLARLFSIPSHTNAALFGPDADALPYRYMRDGVRLLPEELPLYRAAVLGEYATTELDIEFNDGRYITVQQAARPLFDEQGKITGSICTTTDITRQRRETRAVKFLGRASEILASSLALEKTFGSLARHVVPNFADLFIIDLLTESGTTERAVARYVDLGAANAGSRTRAGLQIRGRSLFSLDEFPEHPAHDVMRTGVPFFADDQEGPIAERLTHRPDALKALHNMALTSVIIVPIEARGRTLGVMSLSTSERRHPFDRRDLATVAELARRTATSIDNARLLSAAERLREEAERANRAKSDFLAAMSHELRTPLNAIAGYCQLMLMGLRGQLTPEQREDLERISQNQHHLLGLINSILNYTKLDAGIVHYDTENVSIASILRSVEPMIAPQINARGLRFECELATGEVYIHADEDKLRQILLNLVFNAIKFTPYDGMVTIGYRLVKGHVHIYVTDTGVGIAPEKLPTIFDPFVQVGRTLSTMHEGVGLGLAISRDLARGMGGEIMVKSEPGQGSTFTVVFPQS